jgi:type VI secretion system protein ImpG
MDQRLLRFYNRELQHLREVGGEFAREYPKIAGRLTLPKDAKEEVPDPYVERLLEGFAFLAARIQLKLDAEFPRFTQQLFETVYPHYLCPTPSMTMVRFEPDLTEGALGEGPVIPRQSVLRSLLGKGEQTRCTYTTAHDVRLWPLALVEAEYHTRDLSVLNLPDIRQARAAVRIRLQTTAGLKFNELPLDELILHVRGTGGDAMRLYEQLFTHVKAVVLHPATRPPGWHEYMPASAVRQVGFEDDEALLPYGPRSFQGYRLLHEYFAFPERFMFVGIGGLQRGVRRCEDAVVDVTLLLSEADLELEKVLTAENFSLFCTPAVNLFEKRLDRIHLTDRFPEFHLVSDRTAPLDYEVHSVQSVTGYGARGQTEEQPFESFYRAKDNDPGEAGCYYAIHRTPRMLSERERLGRRRSVSYTGSEAYISLVDITSAPYRPDLRQLGVVALCTNRDLPLHMAVGQGTTDFTLDTGAPVQAMRCLGTPTQPYPSHASGEFAWRLISHLQLNYLSIADTEGGDAASSLGDLLGLYGDMARPEVRRQIEGVRSVLELTLAMDETAFEGSGVFLLGTVLAHFFSKYVSINSFVETVINSVQRGEVKRWPATIGLRHIL